MSNEIETQVNELLNNNGITFSYTFIPFSVSKNRDTNWQSFNYFASLKYKNKIVSTDFSMGIGHSPTNDKNFRTSYGRKIKNEALQKEIESGKACEILGNEKTSLTVYPTEKKIVPKNIDVLHSIILTMDCLDYGTFENWAGDFGYNPDSIKDKEIYEICCKLAVQVKNLLGSELIKEFSELLQDY